MSYLLYPLPLFPSTHRHPPRGRFCRREENAVLLLQRVVCSISETFVLKIVLPETHPSPTHIHFNRQKIDMQTKVERSLFSMVSRTITCH